MNFITRFAKRLRQEWRAIPIAVRTACVWADTPQGRAAEARRWVRKRSRFDCGVAVLAEATGVSYEEAARALNYTRGSVTLERFIHGAHQLGFTVRKSGDSPRPCTDGVSVMLVRPPDYRPRSLSHVVTVRDGVAFDPDFATPYPVADYLRLVDAASRVFYCVLPAEDAQKSQAT